MWNRRVCVRVILFASYAVSAGFAGDASTSLQQQLIAADRGIWQSIAGVRPDIAGVSEAMSPDYVDMELGVSHSREDVLKDLKEVRDFTFQYENPRAELLSTTAGYVIAELRYSSVVSGKKEGGHIMTTSVFSRKHGRWIAHLHTEMEIKPAVGTSNK